MKIYFSTGNSGHYSFSTIKKIAPHHLVSLTYSSIFSRKKLGKSNLELFYLNNLKWNILDSLPVSKKQIRAITIPLPENLSFFGLVRFEHCFQIDLSLVYSLAYYHSPDTVLTFPGNQLDIFFGADAP